MRIAVLGTGEVGRSLAARFAELGHNVSIGTRDVAATRAKEEGWYAAHPQIQLLTQAEAGAHGELIVNATSGAGSVEALTNAGDLDGKILIDVSNSLDFSQGFPPTLFLCNTDSMGELIQRTFPQARVVKSLQTVHNGLMVDPHSLADGNHTMFVCGDDAAAKEVVTGLLHDFGWTDVIDLGGVSNARGTEMLLALWVRLYGTLGTDKFNIKVVR